MLDKLKKIWYNYTNIEGGETMIWKDMSYHKFEECLDEEDLEETTLTEEESDGFNQTNSFILDRYKRLLRTR